MKRIHRALVLLVGLAALPAFAQEIPATAPAKAAPVSINLKMEGVAAEDAFDALAKQAGVEVAVSSPQIWSGADPVFLDVKDGRFWPVFIDVCRQSKLTFADSGGNTRDRSIEITSVASGGRDLAKLQCTVAQDFVIVPLYATRNANLSFDRPQAATSTMTLYMRLLGDPGTGPFQVAGQPTVLEAADENGLSLIQNRSSFTSSYSQNTSALVHTVSLVLAAPREAGKKIARLKGALRVNAAVKTELVIIDAPLTAQAIKKELPEYTLTIQPMRLSTAPARGTTSGKRYQLRLSFEAKPRAEAGGIVRRLETRELLALTQSITVTDSEDRRLLSSRGFSGGDGTSSFEYTLEFSTGSSNRIGEPVKLVWRLPVEGRTITVPFDLADIPIP